MLTSIIDVFAERGTEQHAWLDEHDRWRAAACCVAGTAVRVASSGSGLFLQAGALGAAGLRDLLDQASGVLPAAAISQDVLDAAEEFATRPAPHDSAWSEGAISLLRAAADGARAAGGLGVSTRLWRRERSYACIRPAAGQPAVVRTAFVRLTVTARADSGTGVGQVSIADLPAARLAPDRAARAGRHAAEQAARLAVATCPESTECPVVLAPEAAGLFVHEMIGHALEASPSGAGQLWSRRGSRVTEADLSVVDDPADPQCWEQVTVDEEGERCRRADLLAGGEVAGLLTDRRSAGRLGVPATGHARRGTFSNPPVARMRHTVVLPGTATLEQVIADTKAGILVRAVDTADAIPGQGRFSLRVLDGCQIVGGRLGAELRDFTVSGSQAELRLLDAVCADPSASISVCGRGAAWLPVSHSAPALRLPKLSIRGRAASQDAG